MKVYRFLCDDELKKILTGRVDELGQLGHKFDFECKPNTYRYAPDIKYIHFFKSQTAMKFMNKHHYGSRKYYICTFDIPLSILKSHFGLGFYADWLASVKREFALPVNKFKCDWLVDCIPAYEEDMYEKDR